VSTETGTLRLRCCCGRGRTFHIRADLDPSAGNHPVDQVLACPYAGCQRRCRARVPASALSTSEVFLGEGDTTRLPAGPLIDRTLETEEVP
jgi:hypothetical protein